MRFRVKDLLLFNLLTAIYLAACVRALGNLEKSLPSTTSISQVAFDWAVLIPVGVTFYVATMELVRRSTLRRLSPVVVELPIWVPWRFQARYAVAILAISFLPSLFPKLSAGSICAVVFTSAFVLFGITFFSLLHPRASVCKTGLVYLSGKYPWMKISVLRSVDGEIQKLSTGKKVSGGFVVDVPPEMAGVIEEIIAENSAAHS